MNNNFRYKKFAINSLKQLTLFALLVLISSVSFAQVSSSIDSTKIRIGEQITYQVQVEVDSTDLVVFPEGQTFSPLEMIESYDIDTTKYDAKYSLIKKYGLTQFDSGHYTIPRQKIIIGDKTIFTDSLKVEVNNIVVDSTKQGLYDVKPFITVEKSKTNWWKIPLYVLIALSVVGFLLYWFLWRKKPLTEEEKIALLPPYDRAKLALKKLDESHYLEQEEYKEYYSELTLAIRKYLDEKVYDHALESTTDELISRLQLLKEGNQIDLSRETISNLESIFKRADLVKFAKSAPDKELAKLDRKTVDNEIDHVKEVLPEPSEEEKLLNEQYKLEQERKKKRRKVILSVTVIIGLLIATFVGFGLKYGFTYVKDTIVGNDSKQLLEGDWVRSDYGVPPITISTPEVLKRLEAPKTSTQGQVTSFGYQNASDNLSIMVSTATLPQQQQLQQPQQGQQNTNENQVNLVAVSEEAIKAMEAKGYQNIIVKQEKFVTPNGAEGLKTYGTANIPLAQSDNFIEGEYMMFHFTAQNVIQQIIISWETDDVYAQQMAERMMNSLELKKVE